MGSKCGRYWIFKGISTYTRDYSQFVIIIERGHISLRSMPDKASFTLPMDAMPCHIWARKQAPQWRKSTNTKEEEKPQGNEREEHGEREREIGPTTSRIWWIWFGSLFIDSKQPLQAHYMPPIRLSFSKLSSCIPF